MASRQYRGPKISPSYDGSEVYENLSPGEIALEYTYPAIRRRNEKSLTSDWISLNYYQKLTSGRRCSCWGPETSPSSECEVCYKTGIVGGYQKYGTSSWILDATTSNLAMINMRLNPAQEGPALFRLEDDAVSGEIQATGCMDGSGSIDTINMLSWAGSGSIATYIRTPASTTWIALTETNVTTLLSTPQRFDIKVVFKRSSPETETPLLAKIALRRYLNQETDAIVKANRPRGSRALALSELGVLDEWSTEQWWFDATLSNLTSEDYFYESSRNVRWRAVDTDKLAPQDYLINWNLTVQKVQDFEPFNKFPV